MSIFKKLYEYGYKKYPSILRRVCRSIFSKYSPLYSLSGYFVWNTKCLIKIPFGIHSRVNPSILWKVQFDSALFAIFVSLAPKFIIYRRPWDIIRFFRESTSEPQRVWWIWNFHNNRHCIFFFLENFQVFNRPYGLRVQTELDKSHSWLIRSECYICETGVKTKMGKQKWKSMLGSL